MIQLIHITPELPPTIGGIADYTAILSRRLAEVSGGAVEPALLQAGWREEKAIDTEFPARDLGGQCSAGALAGAITDLVSTTKYKSVLLLEYSGYGYAKRGAPVWLLKGLQNVCGDGKIPLVTMFHELYATGRPWSSSFWLSPQQRYVAARLARLSSAVITNRQQSADWLKKYMSGDKPLHVQPVFSNVGEPETIPPFEEREPIAVIFGGKKMKQRLYTRKEPALEAFFKREGIERNIDIGSSVASITTFGNLPVQKKGFLRAEEISENLKIAKLGLLDYPAEYLTKSGIWAAYAAHGVPTLLISDHITASKKIDFDKLIYFGNITKSNSEVNLLKAGKEAHSWYNLHAKSRRSALNLTTVIKNLQGS